MDAEKWCKEHRNKYFQTGDITEKSKQVCYEILMEFAEEYHQSKVNNGVLDGVSNRRELLESFIDYADSVTLRPIGFSRNYIDGFLRGL